MHIDVPTSWQTSLLDKLAAQVREGHSLQIYGALPSVFPTGRPDDVPNIGHDAAIEHFDYARQLGIETNYLANGSKGARYFSQHPEQGREYFTWITRELRPDLITVSDPELQVALNRQFGWESYCISAIAGIQDRLGLDRWLEATKGCGSVRSLVLHHDVTQCGWQEIQEVANAARNFGIRSKLMMTESCYGGCRVRQAHYASVGQAAETRPALDPYQVSCMLKRLTNPGSLLDLAGFITPEELHRYFADSGIDGFKITGRSYSADWIDRACSYYFSGHSPRNLFEIIVFTSPLLRETLGMEVDQLFHLDFEAYQKYSEKVRGLQPSERSTFTEETAIQLFNSGLLKINDIGAEYGEHKGKLTLIVPGKYASALRNRIREGESGKSAIKIKNLLTA
ncbi:MAG: hypothetical protein WAT12_09115 [Candidatus Nitrotoga sp.]